MARAPVGVGQPVAVRAGAVLAGADRPVCDLDRPISLLFLERYPSPRATLGNWARSAGGALEGSPMEQSHGRGAAAGAAALRPGRVAPARSRPDSQREVVLALMRSLRVVVGQIAELEAQIVLALDAHPDGHIFRSFFRNPRSVICAATLLSEIGDCRARYTVCGRSHPFPTPPDSQRLQGRPGARATSAGRRESVSRLSVVGCTTLRDCLSRQAIV
jgi:hypothetical protein